MATNDVAFKVKNDAEIGKTLKVFGGAEIAKDASSGNVKTVVIGNPTDLSGLYTDLNIFADVTIKGSINSTGVNTDGNLKPATDNLYVLGDSSFRWSSIWGSSVYTQDLFVKDSAFVNKFVVDGETGNTTISGTLGITGDTTAQNLIVNGNLTVNGTTTTVNSTVISVDDKNIELGSIASPTDASADGGGITLKGTTDKTFNWVDATDSWTSNQNLDLASGFSYKINNISVLSNNTLGSGVTASSLTSVGTLTSGTWNASIISPTYGGTGVNNGTKTITLGGNLTTSGAFATTLTVSGATNVTLPTSGTLATTSQKLNVFASTSSSELAGVISDETGTGSLVFGTSPSITDLKAVTSIKDANGNSYFTLNPTTSAVNNIYLTNAATGAGPSISASGSDVNIDFNIGAKGTGQIKLNSNISVSSNAFIPNVYGSSASLGGLLLSSTSNATKGTITIGDLNAGTLTQQAANMNIIIGSATTGGFLKVAPTTGALSIDTSTYALNNQTMYIGTTAVAINRASASLALTGITSIDGSAATLTTARTINTVSFNGSANIVVEPYVEQDLSTAATRYITFVDSSTAGHQRLNLDDTLNYNPSTGNLVATSFNSITGLASATPLENGTAAVGTSTLTARQDHVHPAQTTITGNAGTATTLQTARLINGESFNGSADINIEDKLGVAIASAATTTIGTKGYGNVIHITGTTTITSFGVSNTGTVRRLIFDGILTITHNATSLILPAATNITTAAGDVADFVCENGASGYWRCLNYLDGTISNLEYSYLNGVTSSIQTQLDNKQATLVSGTNIKTVNSTTLLGSGDLTVAAQKGTATVYGGAKFSLSGTVLTITTT